MKSTKKALVLSLLAMLLCVSMLIGTTFAWFTDTATSSNNRIVAGNLDVDLVMFNGENYVSIAGGSGDIFNTAAIAQNKPKSLWEPGKTQIVYLGVQNKGNLALKYNIVLDVTDTDTTDGVNLADVLDYAIIDGAEAGTTSSPSYADWAAVSAAAASTGVIGTLMGEANPARITAASNGTLDEIRNGTKDETDYFVLAVHMQETAGNEYQGKEIVIDLSVVATQKDAEPDSFGPDYDEQATLPAAPAMINRTTSKSFTATTASASTEATVIEDNNAKSTVSAGTTIESVVNDQNETIALSDLTDTDSSLSRTIKTTSENDTVTYDISYQYTYTTVTIDQTTNEETSRTTNTANVTSFTNYVVNELDIGKNLKIVRVTHSHGTSDPVEMTELTAAQLAAANTQGYYYDYTTGILTIVSKDYSKFAVEFDNKVAVTEVTIDKSSATIGVGETVNVSATIVPTDATYKTVTWTSSNTSVATVENGIVTGMAPGAATITATADGKSATCEVTVTQFHSGDGSENYPYEIANVNQWLELVKLGGSVSGTSDKYFSVICDIDVSDVSTRANLKYFAGNIDFNNHSIFGFSANNVMNDINDDGLAAIFSIVSGNVTIKNINFTTSKIQFAGSSSAVALSLTGVDFYNEINITFKNVNIYGTVTGATGNNNALLIAYVYGASATITCDNCNNYATVVGSGFRSVFIGNVGYATGGNANAEQTVVSFDNCHNHGTIISTNEKAAMLFSNSGYPSKNIAVTINNCSNNGTIAGKSSSQLLVNNVDGTASRYITKGSISGNESGVLTIGTLGVNDGKFVLTSTEDAARYELNFSFIARNHAGGSVGYTMNFTGELPNDVFVGKWITLEEAEALEGGEIIYSNGCYKCGENYVFYEEGGRFEWGRQVVVTFVSYDSNDTILSMSTFTYPWNE